MSKIGAQAERGHEIRFPIACGQRGEGQYARCRRAVVALDPTTGAILATYSLVEG
jgi:cell division protein FtsI/penicillin-binding protein 2